MKIVAVAAVLAAWLLPVQASGVAFGPPVTQSREAAPAARQASHDVATHATTGVVRTVSATAIVITRRAAGKRTDTSFVITPSTQKAGKVAAGATVEIRYRTEGGQRIATAVTAEAPQ